MANLAANSFIGNNTGSSATPLALTGTQATALLDTFTSGAKGLVAASGGGTSNFLRADGSWAAPPSGSGTVTSVDMTVPSGLSVSGGPISVSGTFNVTTALNGYVKGNGSGFIAAASVPTTDITGILQPAQFNWGLALAARSGFIAM
jgi:hypothetical protein